MGTPQILYMTYHMILKHKKCHVGKAMPVNFKHGRLVEQGLTSYSTQFRSFRRRCFTGQM